jgi:HSP20 family protein
MTEIEEKKIEVKKEHFTTEEETKIEKTSQEDEKSGTTLQKYRPLSTFGTLDRFFNDMTRWFDNFFCRPTSVWDFKPFSLKVFEEEPFFRTPLSNITEDDEGYHLTAELPGLEKGDLEITIHDGNLEIKGEKKEEIEDKKDGYVRKEYSSSSYYRSFKLPENIEEDKIDATLDKGMLKLDLPKKELEEKEKKKIEIK